MVLGPRLTIFRHPLKHWSLRVPISKRRIAFAPGGSPFHRSITLNCGFRVEPQRRVGYSWDFVRTYEPYWRAGLVGMTTRLLPICLPGQIER